MSDDVSITRLLISPGANTQLYPLLQYITLRLHPQIIKLTIRQFQFILELFLEPLNNIYYHIYFIIFILSGHHE